GSASPGGNSVSSHSGSANILFSSNRLAAVDLASPSGLSTPATVTGLAVGDTLVSIDRRPQNGYLYGLGYNATTPRLQLYVIHPETLVATAVGSTGTFADALGNPVAIGNANASTRFEMDFNPSVDRIRVVSSIGENFRINPNTGAFVDGDLGGAAGSVTGLNMDGALNVGGGAANGHGTAYTNNSSNTSITTQYTLDETVGKLYIQNPPNTGALTLAKTLSPAVFSVLAFDIAAGVNASSSNTAVGSGSGIAVIKQASGVTELLARVDLTNGQISNTTAIGSGGITGLAVQASSIAMVALSSGGANLLRFSSSTPGTVTTAGITGVNAGEVLVGIDYRPATGQLYALGINAGADTGSVYRLDPQTGAATVIGAAGSVAFTTDGVTAVDFPADTNGYGFNFNPAVDRIRVTAGSLNFRLHPDTGLGVDGNNGGAVAVTGSNPDGAINGAATSSTGSAYTNSVAGTTVTTLYALDNVSNSLFIQTPPNAGTLTSGLALTLGGSMLDFSAPLGFDIQSQVRASSNNAAVSSGSAYAALTVSGVTSLYRINLVDGTTTNLGSIGSGTTAIAGLALGQTHVQ
ncbi:MAG TPA: DUF4394 domain-containing protein, partial [Moraxellaceae bacterium]